MHLWSDLGEVSADWLLDESMNLQNDNNLGLWTDADFLFGRTVSETVPEFGVLQGPARPSSPHHRESGLTSLDAIAPVEQSAINLEQFIAHTPQSQSGHEAFQRSPWLWTPKRSESGSLQEPPRLTDAEAEALSSSPFAVELERYPPCVSKRCGTGARDALLLLVQLHNDSAVNVASFPSLMSLDLLLQRFLYEQMTGACSFVHVPSLDPDVCRAELLAAMIASTASSSANPVISNMGLALQEKVRMALGKALYQDDRLVRKVETLQTAILWIEIGLWSGNRRKMEVAESAANNVPTVSRKLSCRCAQLVRHH